MVLTQPSGDSTMGKISFSLLQVYNTYSFLPMHRLFILEKGQRKAFHIIKRKGNFLLIVL
jgi:hypothetical protein